MAAPTETEIQRQKEIKQAEELLFSGRQELGFAKGLFLGNFVADWAMPYPRLSDQEQAEVDAAVSELRQFLDEHLDSDWIDRNADIPREVIDGLGRVGVLGMTAPKAVGGRGFTQMQYCKVLEEIGARDASTAVFTNAHHSIGIRALLLFGTEEQKHTWLPGLMHGEQLAAFAATGAVLAIHLSIHLLDRLIAELTPHYGTDCPVAIVWRASWPDQRIVRATLATLDAAVGAELERTALVLVGRTLGAEEFGESRLYAADYDRRYRPVGPVPRFPEAS